MPGDTFIYLRATRECDWLPINTNCKVNYFAQPSVPQSLKVHSPQSLCKKMSKSAPVILSSSLWLQQQFVETLSNLFSLICLSLGKGGGGWWYFFFFFFFFHDKYSPVEILFNSLVKKHKGMQRVLMPGQTQATAECTSKTIPVLPVPWRLDHCAGGMLSSACQAPTVHRKSRQ